MATSGTYKELTAAYEFTEDASGISGIRQFTDGDATATSSLPDIGDSLDSLDSKYADVKVYQRKKVKHGGHPDKNLWTVLYSNNPNKTDGPRENGASQDPEPTQLPMSGQVGGELLTFDNEKIGTYTWASDSTVVEQQIGLRVITGAFTITKHVSIVPMQSYAHYTGKINSAAFTTAVCTWPISMVLFTGTHYDEYRNDFGTRRWKVDFAFEWKAIRNDDDILTGAWNYLFRPSTAKFESVTPARYSSANLNNLFTDPAFIPTGTLGE